MTLVKQLAMTIALLLLASTVAAGQLQWLSVPSCGDDLAKLKNQLEKETNPTFVLRDAAIGEQGFVPTLKRLSRSGESPESTVAGAAQLALARLGDQQALNELDHEIRSNNTGSVLLAIKTLSLVHSDAALKMLMQYLVTNKLNLRRVRIEGDAVEDPMIPVLKGLIANVEDPPYTQPFLTDPDHLNQWEKWWKETKPPRVVHVYEGMPDAKSECLARLGEWGFEDAPRKLFLDLGKKSIPALEKLADIGNPVAGDKEWPTSLLGSVRGNAQVILAKAGDRKEFEKIVKELDQPGVYQDAIRKFQYISTRDAFEVLLKSLTLNSFPKDRYYAPDGTLHLVGEKLQKDVLAALSEMVVSPPLPPDVAATDANMEKWREWWRVNKDEDVLKNVPF